VSNAHVAQCEIHAVGTVSWKLGWTTETMYYLGSRDNILPLR